MTERDLHLTSRCEGHIENAVLDLAEQHGLEPDDVRRLIHAKIAPYPPVMQCLEAIDKTRRELAGVTNEKAE